MRTYTLLNTLILLITLSLTTSCVSEDDCSTESSSVTSSEESLETSADCSTDDDSSDDSDDDSSDDTDDGSDDSDDSGDDDSTTDPEETIEESFYTPWEDETTAIVIDAYQGNSIDWDEMATDSRVAGVIHRSSIGTRVDTKYESRKEIAKERGYLWGAYHLGYTGNIEAQAELFLDLVGDEEDTLMILDLEDTTNGTFMTIDEAEEFMEIVYERTGRIPVVYANHSTTKSLNSQVASNPLFQQSKLWYARFKSNVYDYPAGIWPNYFLWQFSSEINCSSTGSCLYNVPGTKYDMDVNVYYGTKEDLLVNWNND